MEKYTEKMLCKLSDEEVATIAKKDKTALNHLIIRYRNLVFKIASKYFASGYDNDDIIQEGMIGLYKAILAFNPEISQSFALFSATCIKRRIISAVKASNRKKHQPLNSYVSLYDDQEAGAPLCVNKNEPLSLILDKEYSRGIFVKINNMLSKFELKVLYCYLDGLSYDEIAKLVKKDSKAVDNALYRIKKKLLFLMCKEDV